MHIKAKRPGTLKTLLFVNIPKPHSNHKLKIYNRYTKVKRKKSKCHTKSSYQITREESKRKRKEKKELQKQMEND